MKKIVSLLLFFVLCVGMCACGKKENNPEMIVRNTCFDQYFDSSATGYEKFKGETVGYIVGLLALDSFVYTSRDNLEMLWTEEWTVNENIPFFDEVTAAACLGRNKLNIYHGSMVYQFKGSKRFNALKYVNFYYRYKNIKRGDLSGEFLGL